MGVAEGRSMSVAAMTVLKAVQRQLGLRSVPAICYADNWSAIIQALTTLCRA